eukprot:COSAG02_NODE_26323_length_635_cov_1.139925_1_plen_20_part_01
MDMFVFAFVNEKCIPYYHSI